MNLKQNETLFGEFPAVSTQEWETTIIADLKGELLPNTWSPLRDKYPNGNVKIPWVKS